MGSRDRGRGGPLRPPGPGLCGPQRPQRPRHDGPAGGDRVLLQLPGYAPPAPGLRPLLPPGGAVLPPGAGGAAGPQGLPGAGPEGRRGLPGGKAQGLPPVYPPGRGAGGARRGRGRLCRGRRALNQPETLPSARRHSGEKPGRPGVLPRPALDQHPQRAEGRASDGGDLGAEALRLFGAVVPGRQVPLAGAP